MANVQIFVYAAPQQSPAMQSWKFEMMSFEYPFTFVEAMTQNFANATAGIMQAQVKLWGAPTEPKPGQSWYRAPPAPNPFDWTSWTGPFLPTPFTPWKAVIPVNPAFFAMPGALSLSTLPNMLGANFQPWSTLASFATAMAIFEPAQSYWSGLASRTAEKEARTMAWQAIMWPVSQLDSIVGAVAKAAETPAEFARHRSSGGHAAVAVTLVPEVEVGGSNSVH